MAYDNEDVTIWMFPGPEILVARTTLEKLKETMNIIAKLRCTGVESNESPKDTLDGTGTPMKTSDKTYENVTLDAVYSEDKNSENYSFSQATPSAHLQMLISNPAAFNFFRAGGEYRVTF